jgi:Cu-Zn family superoxide dismutase
MRRQALVAAMAALAVAGLAACSPPGQDTSSSTGSTPAVWSGNPGSGPAGQRSGPSSTAEASPLRATLHDVSGAEVGTASFVDEGGYLEVTVDAHGLQPGFHGLHVHVNGACTGDFASAGGHLQIGDLHPMAGNLTSLFVRKDGTAHLVTDTDSFTLADLKAPGGRSIVVHADPDDFGNIPARYAAAPDAETMATGDAGPRVACGVIG